MAEQPPNQFQAVSNEDVVHHKSKRRDKKNATDAMHLNLTSMIDVIFLLLIYFVITASFAVGEGVITANLPRGSGPAEEDEPPKRPITIEVTTVGTADARINVIGFNDPPRNFKQLAQFLMVHQKNPNKNRHGHYLPDNPVIIQPDGQVRWQHVVNAFNAAVKAQYTNISFAQVGPSG